MDSKTYVENAIRTESRIDQPTVDNRYSFEAVLKAFIAAATLLDMYKKQIYYGKIPDPVKRLNVTNTLIEAAQHLNRGEYIGLKNHDDPLHIDSRVLHAAIGIATESGELMEAIYDKLYLFQRLDLVNLQEEIGDLNWYEAIFVDALNADWDEIRERNIAKLRKRYPEKFTSENAINRDLKAEREILEGGDARMRAEEGYPFGGSDY